MVHLIPEVELVEEVQELRPGTILERRKCRQTSYLSSGDFVYPGFSEAESFQDSGSAKLSKRTLKEKTRDFLMTKSKLRRSQQSFKCTFCPALYSRKFDAQRHERKKHAKELRKSEVKAKKKIVTMPKTWTKEEVEVEAEGSSKLSETSSAVSITDLNLEEPVLSCDLGQSEFNNKLELVMLSDDHKLSKHTDQKCKINGAKLSKRTLKEETKDFSMTKSKLRGKQQSFKCSFCPANYSRKFDARRHERQKHARELRKEETKAKTKMQEEVEAEAEVPSKPSEISPVVDVSETKLEDPILSCDVCQSEFNNKLELIKHLRDNHDDLFQFDDDVLRLNDENKSRSKRYLCNICSSFFRGRKLYIKHHRREHPGKIPDYVRELPKQLFRCEFCSSGFTRYHDLFRHFKRKHLDCIIILDTKRILRKRIVCLLCEEEFSQEDDTASHLQNYHKLANNQIASNLRWTCSQCDERFETMESLVIHGNKMHNAGSEVSSSGLTTYQGVRTTHPKKNVSATPATCDVCGLTFKQRYSLMKHKSMHITLEDRVKYEPIVLSCQVLINNEPNFRCNRCARMFSKEDPFIRHMIFHDTGRAYCCHECGYQCLTQAHLNRHLNIVHLKKRDFKCDICGHAFAEKQAMMDHRRTHTGERPCKCKICGKMFPSWTCVYTHKRTHTDYFPYPCKEPDCKSKFRTKYRLVEHMRRHTGEKPLSCPFATCDKTFYDSRALSRHKTVHTTARPYNCNLCSRSYKHTKYLNFHMKTNHGIKVSQLNEQLNESSV